MACGTFRMSRCLQRMVFGGITTYFAGPILRNGGADCADDPSGWAKAGGTSFASPIMAGIQALINQKTGQNQGNPNSVYYQLAATEYNGSSVRLQLVKRHWGGERLHFLRHHARRYRRQLHR